jgi:alpha-glucosidase
MTNQETEGRHLWWQKGIIYQIYPRSFQDSNGDGIGDLRGILSRLDYLEWLGVDAVWVSPIYKSPMADFGYDISDYCSVHPLFGSLSDFETLLKAVHGRKMKLILDLVPNHSSDQHPWFLESRSSRDNPKRDWYIWKDAGPNGALPNNWLSVFGGPAWQWDEKTGQYYYHAFLKEQPDLNWRNPELQQAMLDAMRFWLDKGVDGFRVDVMWHMIKDDQFRDNPPNPDYRPHQATYEQLIPVHSTDQPEVHDVVRMMRDLLDEFSDRLMIGEIYLPVERLVRYYGTDNKGSHLPFNFQLLNVPWEPGKLFSIIEEYEAALPSGGWPNWVLGNHDQSRIISRIGREQAKIAAMLLLTLRGTPTIYYGEEIGMNDVAIPPNEIQDPQGLNMPGLNLSRDPSRTPMQWDDGTNGGFSTAPPWLRLAASYRRVNVKVEKTDAFSFLNFYKRLIEIRRQEPALHVGTYRSVYSDRQLIAYVREHNEVRLLIVLNMSHRPCYFQTQSFPLRGTIEFSTEPENNGMPVENIICLSGDEGMIVRLKN